MRKVSAFLMALIMVIFSMTTSTANADHVKIDYVALGDSVASGQTPYLEKVGRGFTDMISEALINEGMLGTFKKDYATSGETSVGLLETLSRPEVQQSIQKAELVTIISGANDFINELYNPIDETINIDLSKAITILNNVSVNLTNAIKTVKTLNSEADIYLFSYYFPLPHYEDAVTKGQLETAFSLVNSRLASIAESESITFVDIASEFDKNGKLYLENPKDIHPNEAGYQVIADQFFLNYPIDINNKFPNPTGVWGNIINKIEPVPAYKKWTIITNKVINADSLKASVYLVKDGTKLIHVETELSTNNPKEIIITPPTNGYDSGSYQLMVTNDLKDSAGKSLKTEVLMNFIVK